MAPSSIISGSMPACSPLRFALPRTLLTLGVAVCVGACVFYILSEMRRLEARMEELQTAMEAALRAAAGVDDDDDAGRAPHAGAEAEAEAGAEEDEDEDDEERDDAEAEGAVAAAMHDALVSMVPEPMLSALGLGGDGGIVAPSPPRVLVEIEEEEEEEEAAGDDAEPPADEPQPQPDGGGAAASPTIIPSTSALRASKVDALRELARALGLDDQGTKEALLQRLSQARGEREIAL